MNVDVEYMLDDEGHHLHVYLPGQQMFYLVYDLAPDNDVCQVHLKDISWAKLGITSDIPGLLLALQVLGHVLNEEHDSPMFIIDPAYLMEHHFPAFISPLKTMVDVYETDVGLRWIVKTDAIAKCWQDVFGDEPVIINSEKEPT